MNIVYSGDAATRAFKEKLFQVVVGNEVGLRERLAYSIDFATREDQQ
jgi:hypothetical protein